MWGKRFKKRAERAGKQAKATKLGICCYRSDHQQVTYGPKLSVKTTHHSHRLHMLKKNTHNARVIWCESSIKATNRSYNRFRGRLSSCGLTCEWYLSHHHLNTAEKPANNLVIKVANILTSASNEWNPTSEWASGSPLCSSFFFKGSSSSNYGVKTLKDSQVLWHQG